jgi:hypothetical protein
MLKLRNVGVPLEPCGAAKIWCAVSEARLTASVPLVVSGEPLTLKIDGAVSATLVTVPPVPELLPTIVHAEPESL